MRISSVLLADEAGRLGPGIVCLTGGGGKTTLMYALGRELAAKGSRVLLTTTTRIQRPTQEQSQYYLEDEDPDAIRLPEHPCTFTAARPAAEGHNPEYPRGFDAACIDLLWTSKAADWIIVEADGSACRPLKAPSEKEPVIPSLTCAAIAVVGLSGVGQAFSDRWVFRPGPFALLSGLRPGETVTPEGVARVIAHSQGLLKGTPARAQRAVFLNQADLPGCEAYGLAIASLLLRQHTVLPDCMPLNGVYLGSAWDKPLQCKRIDEDSRGIPTKA